MPVAGSFHTHYWEVSSTQATVVQGNVGYPTWQMAPLSLVLGSGFGGLLPFIERIGTSLLWAWRLGRIICRWSPPKRQALEQAVRILDSELYPHALRAVKMTAVIPGFNEPQAWRQVGQKLKASQGWAENTWRHLEASDHFNQMIRAEGSTASNADRAFFIEMAYQAFAQRAVGSTKA